MARLPTANIKNRRKVTIYPTQEVYESFVRQHIGMQDQLGRYIDKTIHCDAVLIVGMKHAAEVMTEIERIAGSKQNAGN